jgi:hypothetical protein
LYPIIYLIIEIMKRRSMLKRLNLIAVAGFTLMAILFSACRKSLDNGDNVRIPAAGLMAFNLAPDKQVAISIGVNNLTNFSLEYTNYTGGYQPIYVGNRDVTSYDASSGASLATASELFKDSSYYSVFVLGNNGKYKNLIVKDSLNTLASTNGEAFVRYVNGIADSTKQPLVTITSNGTDVFNRNASFASATGFKAITPGSISVKVTDESGINASRNITLDQGKIYTVLLVGIPQATDSAKAVQIKFVQNGVASATP